MHIHAHMKLCIVPCVCIFTVGGLCVCIFYYLCLRHEVNDSLNSFQEVAVNPALKFSC